MILPVRINVDVDEGSFTDRDRLQRFADELAAHAASMLVDDFGDEDDHGGRVDGYEGPFVLAATPRPVELP